MKVSTFVKQMYCGCLQGRTLSYYAPQSVVTSPKTTFLKNEMLFFLRVFLPRCIFAKNDGWTRKSVPFLSIFHVTKRRKMSVVPCLQRISLLLILLRDASPSHDAYGPRSAVTLRLIVRGNASVCVHIVRHEHVKIARSIKVRRTFFSFLFV